jgi:putative tricarboxylic transport membrane protein
MKKISLFITVFFMAVSIIFFVVGIGYPAGTGGSTTGPGFFPMILAGIVFFLCILLLINNRKEKDDSGVFFTKANAPVFLSLLITIFYVVGIAILGFPLATVLYLAGLMKFFKVKNWIFVGVVSLCTSGILYGIFTMFLSVQLPRGMIFY